MSWQEMVAKGDFETAEPLMLAETSAPDGYFPDNEPRAMFYESWGDKLGRTADAVEKYREAENNWAMWASCSTSGGEGTARMSEVRRVEEKIARIVQPQATDVPAGPVAPLEQPDTLWNTLKKMFG